MPNNKLSLQVDIDLVLKALNINAGPVAAAVQQALAKVGADSLGIVPGLELKKSDLSKLTAEVAAALKAGIARGLNIGSSIGFAGATGQQGVQIAQFLGNLMAGVGPARVAGAAQFAPAALAQAAEASQAFKSKEKLIYMSPDQFLGMAEKFKPDPEKLQAIRNVLAAGQALSDVPYLQVGRGEKGVANVTGHEGRHRAMVLKELGFTEMPVVLRATGQGGSIRWDQQAQPGPFDYVQEWPTTLRGQNRPDTMPFPVTREMAGREFAPSAGIDTRQLQFLTQYLARRETALGQQVPMSEVVSVAKEVSTLAADKLGNVYAAAGTKERLQAERMLALLSGEKAPAKYVDGKLQGALTQPAIEKSPALRAAQEAGARVRETTGALQRGGFDTQLAAQLGARVTSYEKALELTQFSTMGRALDKLPPELADRFSRYLKGELGRTAFSPEERKQLQQLAPVVTSLEKAIGAVAQSTAGLPQTKKGTGRLVDPGTEAEKLRPQYEEAARVASQRLQRAAEARISLDEELKDRGLKTKKDRMSDARYLAAVNEEKAATRAATRAEKSLAKLDAMEEAAPYREQTKIAALSQKDVVAAQQGAKAMGTALRDLGDNKLVQIESGFGNVEAAARRAAVATKVFSEQDKTTTSQEAARQAQRNLARIQDARTQPQEAVVLRGLQDEQFIERTAMREQRTLDNVRKRMEELGPLAERDAADIIQRERAQRERLSGLQKQYGELQAQPATAATAAVASQLRGEITLQRGEILQLSKDAAAKQSQLVAGVGAGSKTKEIQANLERLRATAERVQRQMQLLDPGSQAFKGLQAQVPKVIADLNRIQAELKETQSVGNLQLRGQGLSQVAKQIGSKSGAGAARAVADIDAQVRAEREALRTRSLIGQVPGVSGKTADQFIAGRSGLFRNLKQERQQLTSEMEKLAAAGQKGTPVYDQLAERLKEVTRNTKEAAKASREFRSALRQGYTEKAQVANAQRAILGAGQSGVLPLDAMSARYQYGAQVVTAAGGIGNVARSERAVRDRSDLPYVVEYLRAQESSTREKIDKLMARRGPGGPRGPGGGGGDGGGWSPEDEKRLGNLRKEALQYGDAIRRAQQGLVGHNAVLQQASNLMRMFLRYSVGYAALYRGLYAITGLVGNVVELDQALRSIQAVVQATDSEMRTIETSIKRVALATKFTTNEIADAAQILGQAGVAAKDFPSVLASVSQFAAATESSLMISADLFSTMRNVFSELQDTQIANQLTRAVNISKLTSEDLKTILSLSAQMAESFNLSSEQYLAAATTLRNAGIKASTVATGMRQALIEIFAPDNKTLKILSQRYEQLGEILSPEQIKSKFFGFSRTEAPLLNAIGELRRLGYGGSGEGVFAGRTFDVRAENAIKGLVRQFEELQAAESKITFGEAAAEGAATQLESVTNSLKNLGAAITATSYDLASDTLPVIEDLIDATTDWVKGIQEANENLKLMTGDGLASAIRAGLFAGTTAFVTSRSGNLAVRAAQAGGAAIAGGTAAGTLETKGYGELLSNLAAGAIGFLFGGGPKKAADKLAAKAVAPAAAPSLIVSSSGAPLAAAAQSGKIAKVSSALTSGLGKLVTGGAMLAGVFSKIGTGLKFLGSKLFGPWGFLAYVLVDYFDLFEKAGALFKDTFGKAESTFDKLKKRVKGELDTANKARTRRFGEAQDLQKAVEAIRPTNEKGYKAKSGSIPAALEAQVERYDEMQTKLQEAFVGRSETDLRVIASILERINKEASDVGGQAFAEQLQSLETVLGTEVSNLGLTRNQVAELANTVGRTAQQGQGIIEELLREYRTLAEKTDRTQLQQIKFDAYEAAILRFEDIRTQVQTGGELTDQQLQRLYQAVLDELKGIEDADWAEITKQSDVDLNKAIQAAAKEVGDAFIEAGDSIDKIASAFRTMVDLVRDHGETGERALQVQVKRVQDEAAKLDKQIADAEQARQNSFFGRARNSLAYVNQLKRRRTQVALNAQRITERTGQAVAAGNREYAAANLEVESQAYDTRSRLLTVLKANPEVVRNIKDEGGAREALISQFVDLDNLEEVNDGFTQLNELQLEAIKIQERLNEVNNAEKLAAMSVADRNAAVETVKEIGKQLEENKKKQEAVRQTLPTEQTLDTQTGRVRVTENKDLTRAYQAVEAEKSRQQQALETRFEGYVQSDLEREMQRRVFTLRLASEKLRDQGRYAEAMGAAQEAYALEVRLAQKELSFLREKMEKTGDTLKDTQKQALYDQIARKEEEILNLQYRGAKETYDIQVDSAQKMRKRYEDRLDTLQEVMASQLATPQITDWNEFRSLQEQYQSVLDQLIQTIIAEGQLRGATQEEIQQEIKALQASSSSLQALTKAFDESVQFLKEFRDAYDTLFSPDVITGATDVDTAIQRRDYGIREPAQARLESLSMRADNYAAELANLRTKFDEQLRQFNEQTFTSFQEKSGALASLARAQENIQDVANALAELRELTRQASLDINGELAQGFNVEAIMDNLREQVEGTVGSLGETIQDAFGTFFGDVTDTLVDFAFGDLEEDLGTSLDNVAKKFAKDLAKAILKSYLDKALYGILEKITGEKKTPREPATPRSVAAQFQALFDKPIQANDVTVNANNVTVNGLGQGLQPVYSPDAMVNPADYGIGQLPDFSKFSNQYVREGQYKGLNLEFANKLDLLKAEAEKEGIRLQIISGKRTAADTKRIFQDAVRKYGSVAEARRHAAQTYSMHESGFAADIAVPDERTAKFLQERSKKYGLSFPVGTERPDTYKAAGHTHVHAELARARQAIQAGQLPARPPTGTAAGPVEVAVTSMPEVEIAEGGTAAPPVEPAAPAAPAPTPVPAIAPLPASPLAEVGPLPAIEATGAEALRIRQEQLAAFKAKLAEIDASANQQDVELIRTRIAQLEAEVRRLTSEPAAAAPVAQPQVLVPPISQTGAEALKIRQADLEAAKTQLSQLDAKTQTAAFEYVQARIAALETEVTRLQAEIAAQAPADAEARAPRPLVNLPTIQAWERGASLPMPGTSLEDELAHRTMIRDRVRNELNRATENGITSGPAVDSLNAALSFLTARINELSAALSGVAPAPETPPTGPEVSYFPENTKSGAPRRTPPWRIAAGEEGTVSTTDVATASVPSTAEASTSVQQFGSTTQQAEVSVSGLKTGVDLATQGMQGLTQALTDVQAAANISVSGEYGDAKSLAAGARYQDPYTESYGEPVPTITTTPADVSAPIVNVSGAQVNVEGGDGGDGKGKGGFGPAPGNDEFYAEGQAKLKEMGYETQAAQAEKTAGDLNKAGSSISKGAEAIAKGGQKVEAESGGILGGLSGILDGFQGFVGSLGGLLGMLSREFPGVGKVMQGVQLLGTVLGYGFGFKKGGVVGDPPSAKYGVVMPDVQVRAAKGAVLDDQGMAVPDLMVKAATGAVLDENAPDSPRGPVVRHYQSLTGQQASAASDWDRESKDLRTAFLSRLRAQTAAEDAEGQDPKPGAKERKDGVMRAASGRVVQMGKRLKSGLLKGKGTGTSDSIPGVIIGKNGKLQGGIAVSTGESILTKDATTKLGAPFINWVNKNAQRFSTGGVVLPQTARELSSVALSAVSSHSTAQSASMQSVVREVSDRYREILSRTGPSAVRLEVTDSALHRTLKDYVEDYLRDVVATR